MRNVFLGLVLEMSIYLEFILVYFVYKNEILLIFFIINFCEKDLVFRNVNFRKFVDYIKGLVFLIRISCGSIKVFFY